MISTSDILNAGILIVDDKKMNVLLLERMLSEAGYTNVTSTTRSIDVCELHRNNRFDLILLDIEMPGIDGFQVLESLKEIETEEYLPVLVLTAQPDHKLRALKAGAKDFVSKPFDLMEVLIRVHNILEVRLLQRKAQKLYDEIAAEKRSSEQLMLIFRSGPFAMSITSIAGTHIIDVNEKFCRFYGFSREELIGKSVLSLNLWADPEDRACIIQQLLKEGVVSNAELKLKTRSGEVRYALASLELVGLDKKSDQVIVTMFVDITERKQSEKKILRMQRIDSMGTLVGGIAHDMNNILGPILLALQYLKKKITDEKSDKMLDMLTRNANRGAALVKQILTFARGTEGERMTVQIRYPIEELKKFTHETFPLNITVRENVPKDLWTINADPTQIHQVLLNLAVNARDAMPHGGTISITAENITLEKYSASMDRGVQSGPYVLVSVADSGIGIPPEDQEKIFEPFFTTKEVGKGTGLGLATVFSIVKNHGGFIELTSVVGNGANFKVYLPAMIEKEVIEQHVLPTQVFEGHGECILFVDDEYTFREVSKLALESIGYKVILAVDGVDAVSVFSQHHGKIDLVITDMNMPNMDGPALIRILQKLDPSLPIIGTSGLTDTAKLTEMNDLNINAFLSKPYTAGKLFMTIGGILPPPMNNIMYTQRGTTVRTVDASPPYTSLYHAEHETG